VLLLFTVAFTRTVSRTPYWKRYTYSEKRNIHARSFQTTIPVAMESTSVSALATLRAFCSRLTFTERKALITLARSQSIPDLQQSPILFSKVQPVLDRLVYFPPYVNLTDQLTEEGLLVLRLLSSPLTTGLLIVCSLGVELSDDEVLKGRSDSFSKELIATQTPRLPSSWNWSAIVDSSRRPDEVIHPMFPRLSQVQRTFSPQMVNLANRYRGRIIRPHYSRRGISSESITLLLNRLSQRSHFKVHGSRQTFHRSLDRRNVTSLDIVHHYIRTGFWIKGRTEMKQRWYPSNILPRTYFSWGGADIASSSYLRNFFNDLGDTFPSTHRHKRVQPTYLQHPFRTSDGGFLFYDLTSFTSWFHEHEPFLRSVAERFAGVQVFLVGEDLALSTHDLGSLISGYTDNVNHFPEFCVSKGIKVEEGDVSDRSYRHQCAGFLGIPGNLITCTVPHALALSSLVEFASQLQVPGDDVGIAYNDADHMSDIGVCAGTLGKLQFEKVFSTPGLCLYLKRLVIDLGARIDLSPMLIFPLLPYLINPDHKDITSNRFRLPDLKTTRSRAASVLVSFRRDLWNMTKGDIDDDSLSILHLFCVQVHEMVGLPLDAIFQGRVYGEDSDEDEPTRFPDITVKFSFVDASSMKKSPDIDFASKYVTRMTIRATNEVPLTPSFNALRAGQTVIVNRGKSWTFLEDMGYVKVIGIPGEKLELVGSDARDAFLFASEPPLREVAVLQDLNTSQLVASGVLNHAEEEVFEGRDDSGSRHVDLNTRSWRYRRYVDLDDPRGAGMYGRSRDFVFDQLPRERDSLTPEVLDIAQFY